MDKENNSWNYNAEKKKINRENRVSIGNSAKQDKGTGSDTKIKEGNKQAWDDNGIGYVDEWIYIPNNKKIMTLWMLATQDSQKCWNWSNETTGGQELKKMSRNTFKDISNANRTKYNTKRK